MHRPEAFAAPQDRKQIFRRLLHDVGGVDKNRLASEFKMLMKLTRLCGVSLYSLRSSVTTSMKNSGMRLLELRYLTSHSTRDIINEYAGLDPVGAMKSYFDTVRPLLSGITQRAIELGLIPSTTLPGMVQIEGISYLKIPFVSWTSIRENGSLVVGTCLFPLSRDLQALAN